MIAMCSADPVTILKLTSPQAGASARLQVHSQLPFYPAWVLPVILAFAPVFRAGFDELVNRSRMHLVLVLGYGRSKQARGFAVNSNCIGKSYFLTKLSRSFKIQ
jgi:hypothetical protein